MKYCLIIGNKNAGAYKDILPLIAGKKLWFTNDVKKFVSGGGGIKYLEILLDIQTLKQTNHTHQLR